MELLSVCDLGKLEREKIKDDTLMMFIENPNENGLYNHVLEIKIDEDFKYKKINVSEFKKSYLDKYLYKKGSTNGPDYTPTARITTPEKTLNNKIIKCLKDIILEHENHEEIKILEKILSTIMEDKEIILKDIEKNINSKEKYILTLVYNEKDVGDFQIFKDKIRKKSIESYYLIDKKKSIGKEKHCSICKEKKEEVYGNANIFKFYTVDKKGYVAGGFKKLGSWRNFPVCKECAIDLELGKRYLDSNLSFKFQGRDFYLIPKFIYKKDMEKVLKILTRMDSNIDTQYENTEDLVFKRVERLKDYVTFDLLFYEEKNSALNIKLNIQEVLPSRFKKVYNDMSQVNNLFRNSTKFNGKFNLNFSFLNRLFPRKNYNRYFLETVDIIISDKNIDYKFIISYLTKYIIKGFNEEEGKYFYYNTITAYGFLIYLRILGVLFKDRGQMSIMENMYWDIKDYNSKEELFESFFKGNIDFFNTPDKKAVFMVGFSAQKLLNIQYAKENRRPFINRLKGLKLNKKDIRRLLPEIQNKFVEYDANYYRDIESITSLYLLQAGENWSISELDIPFYFSLGMNLEKHINLNKKEEKIND